MDSIIKEKWVNALVSGEYEQGRDVLRTINNEFCCLGVLCDILAKEGKVKWSANREDYSAVVVVPDPQDPRSATTLPRVLREEVGISLGETNDLISMNDNGDSFETIADKIKREL